MPNAYKFIVALFALQISTCIAVASLSLDQISAEIRERCEQQKVRINLVQELRGQLSKRRDLVEAVPPSDEQYLRTEEQAALSQNNAQRMGLVISNKFYRALKVRDAFKGLDKYLAAAVAANTTKHFALHLIDSIYEYEKVTDSINEYLNFDSQRSQPMLSLPKRFTLSVQSSLIKLLLKNIAECAVKSLDEK